jgi:Squalene-hopene cyclase C-terminal domain/Prenyltransferase and squalene oxidase repeat
LPYGTIGDIRTKVTTRYERIAVDCAGVRPDVSKAQRKRAGLLAGSASTPPASVSPTPGTAASATAVRPAVAAVVAGLTVLALATLAGVGIAAPTAHGAHIGDRAQAIGFLERRQVDGGGFAEVGRAPDPALTAWVVLGLAAAGRDPSTVTVAGKSPADFLAGKPYPVATDLELRILALDALRRAPSVLVDQLEQLRRGSGAIGPSVNATIWGILALRSAGRPAGSRTVSYLLRQQRKDGGWSWFAGIASDSNDTAAAIQALRSAGVARSSKAIVRGLAYLRRLQNADGGFELDQGRGSDAQSTAWAIQAFLAAGRRPPAAAYRYLARLQRANGSYRYSARYGTTPVWVTAQVLPALARRPFPLP